MIAALATTAELGAARAKVQAAEEALARHRQRSFATAHLNITGAAGTYQDTNGVTVANHVLTIETEGQTLYVPCRLVVGDAPTS